MRVAGLACLLALSLASPLVAADAPSELTGPDAKQKLTGHVLVWADAMWQLDADKPDGLRLAKLDGPRAQQLGRVVPARVVKAAGELVEVELVDAPACTWATLPLPDELKQIRLFVKRADLAPVVTKRFTKTYKNGSKLTVAPGLPVMPVDGGVKISIDGDELIVPIPKTSIGFAYPAKRVVPRSYKNLNHELAAGTEVLLGDVPLVIKHADASARSYTKRKDRALFPLTAACIDATVSAPVAGVASIAADGGESRFVGMLGPGVPFGDRFYVPKGTRFARASGRTVAVAKHEITLMEPMPLETEACMEWIIGVETQPSNAPPLAQTNDAERKLRLCVPLDKVKREPAQLRNSPF